MSANLPTHFVQQYSTNIQLLLQTKGGKFSQHVMRGTHQGKAASPVDQFGAVEMQPVTSRFAPMGRVDAATDRRWVYPSDFDLPQQIDSFDKLKMITDPSSMYVQNAVNAALRQQDRLILAAFTGTAKTGETGATSTIFTAANEVDVAVGGANSKLNVAKIKAVKELMEANDVDFETEEVFIGITAADHASLLNEIQVISSDFNSGAPILQQGRVVEFLGFKLIQSQLVETVLAGTNEVTLPVWCKSGMHCGIWDEMKTDVSQRKDLQGLPWQVYLTMSAGATRLEEDKVYAIESYRA
jgi:galactitol-specific phosphotransferase system IIB component